MPFNNHLRRQRAQTAIDAYKTTGVESGGDEQLLTDLLADLRHWAAEEKVDFYRVIAMSQTHYEEEK